MVTIKSSFMAMYLSNTLKHNSLTKLKCRMSFMFEHEKCGSYLAAVIDLYSRNVVGWSTISIIKPSLVYDVTDMAIRPRRPKAVLIVHSDQGVQNTSMVY
jgi:transposase InsO family protein